jgi:hypothetical protein
MHDSRPVHADVVVITKFQEFSASKFEAIIGDDGVRHSKPVDDVHEKGHNLFDTEICDRACLNPLGKFIHDNQQVGVATGCLSQGPNDVQPPHGERPCDGYGLQGMSREIGLAGVELAPLAGAHGLVGARDNSGPVKALAECIAHEDAQRHVVDTHAHVDVSNKLLTVGDGDASLQDAGRGMLVQLAIDYSE